MRPRNEGPGPGRRTRPWEVVGDRQNGGEIGHGLVAGDQGSRVMRLSLARWATAVADLDPGDAYRLAAGIIDQLRDAGYLSEPPT